VLYYYDYYYYHAAFNAPCVGHKDDESQELFELFVQSTQFCSVLLYCIVSVLTNKIFIHSFIPLSG